MPVKKEGKMEERCLLLLNARFQRMRAALEISTSKAEEALSSGRDASYLLI